MGLFICAAGGACSLAFAAAWCRDDLGEACERPGIGQLFRPAELSCVQQLCRCFRQLADWQLYPELVQSHHSNGNWCGGDLLHDWLCAGGLQIQVKPFGFLHVCGFDHEISEKEDKVMSDLEMKLVSKILND